ncbi:hypothetical protein GM3709_794 [Geminocystis sp. NIES-3709]|nr:hypothetical protein GM3709_794 [Geminocystis sp. NIES-3709]
MGNKYSDEGKETGDKINSLSTLKFLCTFNINDRMVRDQQFLFIIVR